MHDGRIKTLMKFLTVGVIVCCWVRDIARIEIRSRQRHPLISSPDQVNPGSPRRSRVAFGVFGQIFWAVLAFEERLKGRSNPRGAMTIDFKQLFNAANPSRALRADLPEDQQYYIDFSEVRGGRVVEDMQDNITLFSDDKPTCQLFTGHIGCGKSTELSQLQQSLERLGYRVVYFESSENLEMADVDVGDILMAIAQRLFTRLAEWRVTMEAKGFRALLAGAAKVLQTEIDLRAEASTPFGELVADTATGEASLAIPLGIGKLTAKVKESPELRSKLRSYMEPRTQGILEALNKEVIIPAIAMLKQQGKAGLVIIVDNLDRIDNSPKPWGRLQHEYLFVDRGDQLRQLQCHLVYTMPLNLRFSGSYGQLTQRFDTPHILPMISVLNRDGSVFEAGLAKMRQMVLARAMPQLSEGERSARVTHYFDRPETLDYLCLASGGHVRNVLRFLQDGLKKERGLPVSRAALAEAIKKRRNEMTLSIEDSEWALLREVSRTKKVVGDEGYQRLIRSLYVYEYQDEEGSWFDVNPILKDVPEFQR